MIITAGMLACILASGPRLETLTIEEALKQAQAQNLDLKAAQAKLDQAREISSKAWSGYLPQISAGASYTRNRDAASISLPTAFWVRDMSGMPGFDPNTYNGPPYDPTKGLPTMPPDASNPPGLPSNSILYPAGFQTIDIQKKEQYGAQVQVNQALIVPALWPAIHNAYLAEKVAELTVENARREILFGVAQLYYGAVSLKESIAVQHKLLENNAAHERDAQVRYDAGATPRIGLVRAKIDRAKAEQDLRRAENAYASAKIALATLLDRENNFDVGRPESAPEPPSAGDLEATAMANRPDVQAAETSLTLADGGRTQAWAKYAPALFANALWRIANVKGFTNRYDTWAVGLAASWSLLDGGLREAELREAGAKVVEARASLRSTQNKAREEVRRAALDLESARANRSKAQEQLQLARENIQLVNVNYTSGAATQLDVSDASSALAGAELGFLAESLNADLAALRLAKAVGAFDPVQ